MRMKITTAPQIASKDQAINEKDETKKDEGNTYYVEFSKKHGDQTDFTAAYHTLIQEVLSFAIDSV